MTRRKILILIPLICIALLLAYTWVLIVVADYAATWRHYIGLSLFLFLIYLFVKDLSKCIVATGIYLIIASFNLFALTPGVTSNSLSLTVSGASISTPSFSLLGIGLFIFYSILNMDSLINIRLDYREARERKRR